MRSGAVFGIGGTEIVVIAMVALLLFGPDKLPQLGRTVGRFLRDFKRYQDIMEATIRAEMYASEGGKPDPFKTGKDFREKVQAQQAEAAAKAAEKPAGEPAEEPADDADEHAEPVTVDATEPDADTVEGEGERS